TQDELAGDIRVALALRDQVQDLALALRQLGERPWRGSRLGRGEEVDQPRRDGGAEDGFSTADGLDGPQHLSFFGVFEHIAPGPRPHCREDRGVVFEHRDNEDANMRAIAHDAPRRLDAVDAGHLNVHQDHVWLQSGRHGDGLVACRRLTHHLDIWRRVEQRMDPVAKQRVVISYEHSQWLHHGISFEVAATWADAWVSRGSRAIMRVPPSSSASTTHVPPSSSARSRIESSPTP